MYRIKSLLIGFFIFFSISAFTQENTDPKIDSLLSVLKKTENDKKADIYNQLANYCLSKRNMNGCFEYTNKAYDLSKESGDEVNLMISSNNLGLLNYLLGDFKTANKHLQLALELAKKLGNTRESIKAYNTLAFIAEAKNEFQVALSYYEKSLKLAREQDDKTELSKTLINVGPLYQQKGQNQKAIDAYEEALKLKKELKDEKGIATAYYQLGNVYLAIDLLELALQNMQDAQRSFEILGDSNGISACYNGIGLTYSNMRLYDEAVESYNKSLKIYQDFNMQNEIANVLSNIGIVLIKKKEFDQAFANFEKALEIRESTNDLVNIAKIKQNMGMTMLESKQYQKSLVYFKEALKINTEQNNLAEKAANLHALGIAYTKLRNYNLAENYLNQSKQISIDLKFKNQLKENYKAFSELYKEIGQYAKALEYHEKYFLVHDTLLGKDMQEKLTDMQVKYETEKKEREIEKEKLENQKSQAELDKTIAEKKRLRAFNIFIGIGLILVLGLVAVVFKSLQQKKRDNKIIEAEKEKSEKLLLNTLPIKVVKDLKEKGKTEPENFDGVTVYFSDVVGFTTLSSGLEPKFLISELNEIFTAFDDIMYRNHCERIKTIGDAYMAVCGMPERNKDHAENMLKSSIEILNYLEDRNAKNDLKWRIRIGLNSGKVVGGIVGVRKYLYDVFGDTINTASRMESNSEPMRINISDQTYEILKDKYGFEKRAPLEVKGKGVMQMYFLNNDEVFKSIKA